MGKLVTDNEPEGIMKQTEEHRKKAWEKEKLKGISKEVIPPKVIEVTMKQTDPRKASKMRFENDKDMD